MQISLKTADPDDRRVLQDLVNDLSRNDYVRRNLRVEWQADDRDGMAAELAVAHLVLDAGFKIANLALAFVKWRRESRTAVPLAVTANGRTTTLSLEDMGDPHDGPGAVRRALVGAPDPRQSLCVLIGVSHYDTMPALPGVRTNLRDLRDVLRDPEVWGVPDDRVRLITNPGSADTVLEAVTEAAAEAKDTLLVYVAGHGLHDRQHGLRLALPPASGRDTEHTVRWNELAEAVGRGSARRRVVWLDCCYAGLAVPAADGGTAGHRHPALVDAARTDGTYLIAATQRSDTASAAGAGCTAFTGALVEVLRDGVDPGRPTEEFLTLNVVFRRVSGALQQKRLPEPAFHDPDDIGDHPQFRNASVQQRGEDPPPPPPPSGTPSGTGSEPARPSRWPWSTWSRRTRWTAAVGALALLLAVGAGAVAWVTPGDVVSGLSLTQYCSSLAPQSPQRFTVAASNCVQPIDLDDACSWQYRSPDLRARFTSPDPNSAVCVDPGSNVTYDGGISDMSGYCATRTTLPDVAATATDPAYANRWVCRLPINADLACDTQNNRVDLVGRQEDGRWVCRED